MSTAPFRIFPSVEALAEAAADLIVDGVRKATAASRPYLLGCPGGRTPRPVYDAVGRRVATESVDCSQMHVVMMDEYLAPGADMSRLVDADAHYSCRRFAEHEIRSVINDGLSERHHMPAANIWVPDPRDPEAYDRRIEDGGGTDLFLVASGASDGHVAFCGPGADLDGSTSLVALAPSTRADNLVTFPRFRELHEVPEHGVSIGLGTIRRLSQSVLLLLHGSDKQLSARWIAGGSYRPEWPATFVHECDQAAVWMDAIAAEGAS